MTNLDEPHSAAHGGRAQRRHRTILNSRLAGAAPVLGRAVEEQGLVEALAWER